MRIIPGDFPDVWYDTGDLSEESLIIIRRESITCCGFLGGDTIQVISSGTAFADLLNQYRPYIPNQEEGKRYHYEMQQIPDRKDRIMTALSSLDKNSQGEQIERISEWEAVLSLINQSLWFTGMLDPFRYELQLSGDIHNFLKNPVYSERLIHCLHWWYYHEASLQEREQNTMVPTIMKLLYPAHHDLIIRAINLYNHGTYEVARDFKPPNPGY